MNRDIVYLKEIRDEIARVERFTAEGKNAFLSNEMIHYAVSRAIQTIGEATKKLSPQIKDAHQSVPWKRIAGMRDIIVHDYAAVELDVVWQTVVEDLPKLDECVRLALRQSGE